MNFSENILQQIEDYLNGSMTAEQIAAFKNQMNDNPELSEAVKINKELQLQYGDDNWNFIKDDKKNKDLNELESLLKSDDFKNKKKAIQSASDLYFKKGKSKNSNKNKPKLYYLLAIAAALVIFFGIFLKDNSISNQEIYSDYSSWDELPSLVSRSETNAVLLSTGENAFINKNYKLASESFGSYINSKPQVNPTALLYLGISQLELKNYNEALESFQKVIDSESLDKSKGYWYKALTYLKMDDIDKATEQLQIIISDSLNYNYTEANVILDKLKN